MVARPGSYQTTASWFSRVTRARDTPFTASSADRTAPMHPSHVIPEIVSVTVFGLDAFFPLWKAADNAPDAAGVRPIRLKNSRLFSM
jgi:hypothetical protein